MGKSENIHIGIIPDGNRRWAKNHNKKIKEGHKKGKEVLENIIHHIEEEHPEIKTITVYALSEENFKKRCKEELNILWDLFKEKLLKLNKENSLRVRVIGDYSQYPNKIKNLVLDVVSGTRHITERTLNILLLFGKNKGELKTDIDLIIRTGGRHSLSGFAPLASRYAELRVRDVMWGNYDVEKFEEDLQWFHTQRRSFGK